MDLKIATGIAYEDLVLAHNICEVNIEPAPLTISDRTKLRYYLTLQIQPYPNASTWESLPPMDGVEEIPEVVGGATVARGAFFNIEKILASYVGGQAPTFGQSLIMPVTGIIRAFRYVERVENNGAVVRTSTSKVMYAIAAGVNERYFPAYGKKLFSSIVGINRKFCTYSPIFSVFPEQDVFLYFVNNLRPNAEALKLRHYRYYLDGSCDNEPETKMLTLAQAMNMYAVPVSPAVLKLSNNVSSYTVWLLNEKDEVVSEMKTYRINREYYESKRNIIFRNSLGGYDSLMCVGRASEGLSLIKEESLRFKDFEAPAQFSETVVNEVTGERQLTLNTGWQSEEVREWLEELVLSTDIYIKTDRDYLPLKLVDESYLAADSKEYLIGRTLVFAYCNKERSYSKLPILEAVPTRATGWRAYSYGACQLDAYGKRTGKQYVTHLEKYYLDDNTAVKPATVKENAIGTEGYLDAIINGECAATPYVNAAYSAYGTYKRNTCASGLFGGPALIAIAAGRWGSETSQAAANDKAVAEWNALNTQTTADQSGSCSTMQPGGLRTKYYKFSVNPTSVPPTNIFSTTPIRTQIQSNFNISNESLVADGLPQDYIAMRAVGYIQAPITGAVTFYFKSDDGKRVYMSDTPNGGLENKIDNWLQQGTKEHSFRMNLTAGMMYKFQLDYFDYNGTAVLTAQWSYGGQAKTDIPTDKMHYE